MDDDAKNQSSEELTASYSFREIVLHTKWVIHYCSLLDKSFGLVFYFFSLLSNVKGVVSIAVYGFIINAIAGFSQHGFNSAAAWQAFGFYAAYHLADNLLTIFEQSFVINRKTALQTQLKRAYLHKLLRTDFNHMDKKTTNEDLVAGYSASESLFVHFSGSISLLSHLTTSVILLVIITYFAWPLALILILLTIPRFWLDKLMRKRYALSQKKAKPLTVRLRQLLKTWLDRSNIFQITSPQIAGFFDQKYLSLQKNYQKSTGNAKSQWQAVNKILDLGNSLASMVGYAWVLFKNASLSGVGSIYVQLRLINLLETKLKQTVTSYNSLEESCTKVIEVESVFNWPETTPDLNNPSVATSALELNNVSVARVGIPVPLLDNLQVTFNSGEKTDIIITDPVVKELFSRLLTFRLVPSAGQLLLNNQPAKTAPPDLFCVLSSASYFPFLSVVENITLSPDPKESPDLEAVMRSVSIFGQVPPELPLPPDPGLVARILTARVLYQKPQWLLWLADKNVGPKTEREMFELIYSSVPSVITLTDKISSSSKADRVILVKLGKILEQGTPAELIQAGGEYAKWLDRAIPKAPPPTSPTGSLVESLS